MSKEYSALSDERLAEMGREGDMAAFGALCDRHLSSVYNRLRALLPPEAVDDVTQEVFLAATRGIRNYRGQSTFRTWLSAIVRHKVADYYRRGGNRREVLSLEEVNSPPAADGGWEERVAVRIALRRLPVHYQEVILLRLAEGLPFAQVAQALGITLEAAKSRYRRAVQAVAREMQTDTEK